ncbi:hypothetical protein OD781_35490 [Pseudomonas aeruginosa]|uniref:hypothetical protein n=2 Tax=Pseudomonas aeruginosa TaxID=287 RepID=UPI0021F1850D|nr:hypothetical protein [Pseudomonas aeruginosa]MCV4065667.1 hypothetical protein [Pseudomonas aeruginosa]MCV4153861.1 hypothetical protein [Pseudomonas aeruginosa]MDS9784430.1 hypothetical protein [Pseudomonas aeruginosa]HBO6281917.1 hypothetical protein [Pseudomonas aeruginosa]
MTNANECTCPSGDGSLRHPCQAHPAPVELAGVAATLTFINGRPAMCGCQVEYSSGGGEYSDVIYVTLCAKHSGSAILDLVATNRIALTPEYEGQWHADLYLDREIPLAKAEGATPAEAVLALMSAERIDPEQESVEQAGGDERAAFEAYRDRRNALLESEGHKPGSKWHVTNAHYPTWEASRAALAQPSPALPPFAEKVLAKLRRFYDCAEDFESGGVDIGRHWLDLLTQLGLLNRVQRSPAFWEISQQGEDLLGMPQPSPAQAEQAEAERPEVVAYLFVKPDGTLSMDAVRHKPSQPAVAVMTVAQHERIVEARWNRAMDLLLDHVSRISEKFKAERDAALARVAELEACGAPALLAAADYFAERAKGPSPGWVTLSAVAKELRVRADKAPVAQAQHSVPEASEQEKEQGWTLDYRFVELVTEIAASRTEFTTSMEATEQVLLAARELLAAAPDKEVPQAWLDVRAERRRQIEAKGWTPEHDDLYCSAELPRAAAAYILNGANDEAPAIWPFVAKWWKPRDARSNYVRAGALILAEIERLDRAAHGKEVGHE